MKEDYFIKVGKDLIKSWGFVSPKTGELIPLTLIDKIIYSYLVHRFHMFVNIQQGDFYETQESIARECNTSRRKVTELIKTLIDNEVVFAVRGFKGNWVYKVIRPLVLCKEKPVGVSSPVQTKKKEKESYKPSPSLIDDEEYDDPF